MKIEINYTPEPNQQTVHEDRHRYRVVCAGRKFGKSVLARHELIRKALFHVPKEQTEGVYQPPNFWIVSPTIKQGKLNHWRQLMAEIPAEFIRKTNNTELQIELVNGSILHILGSENADKIRGAGVIGMVVDEAAYIPERTWEMVLEPELFSTKGWALFISTPRGFNWFADVYNRGQISHEDYDDDWASWRFTSYETPRAKDPVRLKFLNKKQEQSAQETFAQEFLADFTKLEGLIYKSFSRKSHVIEPFAIPKEWPCYRAIDWGAKDPTCVLFFTLDPNGRIFLTDEIYETDITTTELATKIKSKSYGRNIVNTFADPSGRQNILNLQNEHQIPVVKALRETSTTKKNWVNLGIDLVQEKLKGLLEDEKPALQVFDRCENFLKEIQLYSWKENPNPEMNSPGIPEDANNHAMDAGRYFFVSYQRPDEYYPEDDRKDWSFKK